ncbi:MAG: hypothetical protein Q7J54_01935 [Candidatus Woesearchaeota archaeon]|nr:hypothetical protein [Candidatus Woesearchaeota archaeon]
MGNERRSKTDLILSVLDNIHEQEKTIGELSLILKTNWNSVKDTLEFLKKIGQVEERTINSEKKYIAVKYGIGDKNIPTYFNLPIQKNVEHFAGYIYKKITHYFRSTKQITPNTTQLQKISVKIFDDQWIRAKISVPTGWYRFGKISIFGVRRGDTFDEYKDEEFDNDNKLQTIIKKAVQDFADEQYTFNARKKQYETENKQQYLLLLELEKMQLLLSNPEKNKDILLRNLDSFINSIPPEQKTAEVIKLFYDFKSMLQEFITNKPKMSNDIKDLLCQTFQRLWDVVATLNFYDSLLEQKSYSKETLDQFILPDILQKELMARLTFDELKGKIAS